MKAWLRKNGGFALFSILSLLSLIRLLKQSVPGHYRVFTGAGRALWHLQNPYGTDFGTHVGYYFYSPTCAMTIFGPLSVLPERLGIIVYMGLSWLVFVLGARAFWRVFAMSQKASLLQWFWVAITAQMFGSVLSSKLEILIAGLLLLCLAWLKETAGKFNARTILACLLLAATLNWKFQPLPLLGLAMLSWLVVQKDIRVPAFIAMALGGFYLLPFAFFPREFLLTAHDTWHETFGNFVQTSFLNFENLFAFIHNSFGIPISFTTSQVVSGIVGSAMATYLITWILKHRQNSGQLLRGAMLISTALGATFMTTLSPLGQNNALILYSPLLLTSFVCLSDQGDGVRQRRWAWIIGACVAVMTLIYSDAVPLTLQNEFRHLTLKPLACLALGIAVAWELWTGAPYKSERTAMAP